MVLEIVLFDLSLYQYEITSRFYCKQLFANYSKLKRNFHSIGDVPSIPILPDVRLSNFTLNFDQDPPVYDSHNVIFDIASGFIGIGANMTGTPSFIQLSK